MGGDGRCHVFTIVSVLGTIKDLSPLAPVTFSTCKMEIFILSFIKIIIIIIVMELRKVKF